MLPLKCKIFVILHSITSISEKISSKSLFNTLYSGHKPWTGFFRSQLAESNIVLDVLSKKRSLYLPLRSSLETSSIFSFTLSEVVPCPRVLILATR
ncbi:UNVERIFIED_CONTAM: hypothetical protein NCL1_14994 [Trichonephila clavipes]